MITTDATGRFLEAQLKEWDRQDEEQTGARLKPVIAITRVPGCGGESIARTLAKEFGLVLYDWEIVEAIAKDAHVSEQVVATMDEKYTSELDEWLAGFTGGPSLSSYKYMQCLRRVLFTVATHGNAVILGRGANFLLPPEKKTLGLCLAAPLEARVKNVMQAMRLSQENARKYIAKIEQEQRTWVKKHGCADINDVTHYHLVINTALVTPQTIVQIVKGFIGPES